MTIKDLISNKDYDYIEWRVTSPKVLDEPDIFFGYCKSKNGKLISLDGDSYYDNEIVLLYEEWTSDGIPNGLTVIVKVDWIGGDV